MGLIKRFFRIYRGNSHIWDRGFLAIPSLGYPAIWCQFDVYRWFLEIDSPATFGSPSWAILGGSTKWLWKKVSVLGSWGDFAMLQLSSRACEKNPQWFRNFLNILSNVMSPSISKHSKPPWGFPWNFPFLSEEIFPVLNLASSVEFPHPGSKEKKALEELWKAPTWDGYGSIPMKIPFLMGWTSILTQLFWCELQGYYWFWHTARCLSFSVMFRLESWRPWICPKLQDEAKSRVRLQKRHFFSGWILYGLWCKLVEHTHMKELSLGTIVTIVSIATIYI